jgi:hypothetical protein
MDGSRPAWRTTSANDACALTLIVEQSVGAIFGTEETYTVRLWAKHPTAKRVGTRKERMVRFEGKKTRETSAIEGEGHLAKGR